MTEVTNRTGTFTTTVERDGAEVVVKWGCEARRFTVEDLAAVLTTFELLAPETPGLWVRDRDSHSQRFAVYIDEDGDFHAEDGVAESHDWRHVPWEEFKAALEAAINQTPATAS